MEENLQPPINSQPIESNPVLEPLVVPPKSKSVLPYIVVMIIAAISAGAFYFYNQNTALKTQLASVSSPSPKAINPDSQDPLLYQDSLGKFSFQYPSSVLIEEKTNEILLTINNHIVKVIPNSAHQWGEGMSQDELDKLYVVLVQYPDNPSKGMYPDSAVLFWAEFESKKEKDNSVELLNSIDQIVSTVKFTQDANTQSILDIIPALTTPMVWSKPVSGTLPDLDGKEIGGAIITAPTPSKQDNKLSPLLESNSILTTKYGWSNMQAADGMGEQIITYEKESTKLIIWRKNNQYQILLSN